MTTEVDDGAVARRRTVASDWQSRVIVGENVGASAPPAWLAASYQLFRSQVMDSAYPCFFGTQAERAGEMFYSYGSSQDLTHLPRTMATFFELSRTREHEKNNFALFFEPEPAVLEHDEYRTIFWRTLQLLHDNDAVPLPPDQASDPSDPSWEFTYHGQQLFVVGCCPSYQRRRSRNLGPGMIMLFQPRTVFVDAVTKRAIGPQARAEVRRRLLAWDGIPHHPDLGVYGDPENREWKQYFLPDDQEPVQGRCPFTAHERGVPTIDAPPISLEQPMEARASADQVVPPFATLVEALRHHAAVRPDQVAIRFLVDGERQEETCTYAQLDRMASRLAEDMLRRAQRGDRALLLLPNGIDYAVSFFACLYAGIIAVPAYPVDQTNSQHQMRLQAMRQDCTPRLLLTDVANEALLSKLGGDESADVVVVGREAEGESDWFPREIPPEHVAFLQYTSGSTASPKGVVVSHANLVANAMVLQGAMEFCVSDVMVSWLPLYHDMGLILGLLAPICFGFPVVLMTPQHFAGRPSRWLRAVSRYRGTVSGAPDFAFQLCVDRIGDELALELDLRSWRLAWCGAEPIRLATMEAFAARFARSGLRSEALYPCYGLAEATLMVSGGRAGSGPQAASFSAEGLARGEAVPDAAGTPLMNCGAAQPLHNIRIVDPSTLTECLAGRVGEIWVTGPSIAGGYWENPSATKETFEAHLTGAASEPYLRTGDLGFLVDGKLFINGRHKDLIIVRGQNLYPQDIESVVSERVPDLRKGRIAAFPVTGEAGEAIGIAAELPRGASRRRGTDEIFDAITDAITSVYQEPVGVILLLEPGTLPRTTSGKLRRSACLTLWKDGVLEPAAALVRDDGERQVADAPALADPVQSDVEQQVAVVWRDVFGRDVRAGDDFFDLGGQSLTAAQLAARLSDIFDLELPLRWVFETRTIAKLARRLDQEFAARQTGDRRPPLLARVGQHRVPLSFAQERLWFLWRLDPGGAAYNVAGAWRLTGPLDVAALQRAVRSLVVRHEILRTQIEDSDGRAFQVVSSAPDFGWELRNLAGLAGADQAMLLRQTLQEIANAPFDLERGPLLRTKLLAFGEHEHVLALAMHHIVSDGWSVSILLKELAALYAAACEGAEPDLPALPIQYGDYALWQRQTLTDDRLTAQLAFWRDRLGSEHLMLRLPAPAQDSQNRSGAARIIRSVSGEVVAGLRLLSRARGVTLFMTLLAAFDVVLSRYSGSRDLRVAVPSAGRQRVETEGLIGFFVNTLVIRTELTGAMRFTELLDQVRERVLEAQANQDVPFERIVADLQPQRQPGRNPLASVKFLLQQDWAGAAQFRGLQCEPTDVASDAARFDLALDALETDAGLTCQFTYATDLVDAESVSRLADDYVALLADITQLGNLRVSDVHARAVETARLRDPQHHESILTRVATLAAERGTDPALVHEGMRLDWASLWSWSARLAGRLSQLGVTRETPVAVCLPRSLALVASMLAIWRAGGVYVPLDPAMPEDRISWQIMDSGARCVIARIELQLPEGVVRVDPHDAGTTPPDTTAPHGDQAAYVTYTSGSTGRPKGVVISHRSATSYVRALLDRLPAGIASAAWVSTPAADLGHTVLFGSLWAGWTLHLISEARAFDPDAFADYMAEHRVDALKIVPSHLGGLLEAARPQDVLPERCLIVGGEATTAAMAARVAVLKPGCHVLNHYGPTETTVGVMTGQGTETSGATLPLGRPLAHSRIQLRDVDGNPVPQGAPGEICIGGEGVARGYLGRPGMTAERFVPDEYGSPGSRLYRTGDNARQFFSGAFEFLGRLDDQVKIRGYRVEPEEVAVQLRALAGVREAVVIGRADGEGRPRLVGYVTGDGLDGTGLKEALATKLPDYMVPSAIVVLRSWPLNRNGKVDRQALPDPEKEISSAQVAPRDEKEAALLEIWQSVLKRDNIGVTDNFFELGGDSILSLQVVAKARRAGLKLTPKQAFEHPTIEGAALVALPLATAKPALPVSPAPPIAVPTDVDLERLGLRRDEVQQIYPATPLQQGLIYHALLQAGQGFYLRQLRLSIPGPLDWAVLRAVWETAVARHDVLRTHIEWRHGGEVLQVVHRQAPLPYEEHDWSAEDEAAYEDRLAAWLAADLARGLELTKPPLMRVNLFARSDGTHDLIWSGHHVLLDGWSAAQLLGEMRQDYRARISGLPATLPERASFRDYVAWLQQQPSTEAWWRGRLGELSDAARLTESLGRPHEVEPGTHHLNQALDPQLYERLKAAAQQRQVTLNTLMQGAWAILLARYGGRQRVVFGATVSGRPAELAGVERMLGLFINSLPILVDVSGAAPVTDWLQYLQRHNVELREYEHTPLSDLQRWAGAQGGALFDSLLVFENYPVDDAGDASGLPVRAVESLQRTHYPLTLTIERGMTLAWAWDGTRFERGSIARLSRHYVEILEKLILDGPAHVGEIGPSVEPCQRRPLIGDSFRSVAERIAQQAEERPAREAVSCAGTRLSYGELGEWSNRIAWRLKRMGLSREECVGICLERSAALVAGLLGVLQAGGTYVPLDPSYPPDRLRHMIEDSGICRIVTEHETAARLQGLFAGLELVIVSDVTDEPVAVLRERVHPEQLAYVIYTSGSTGRPKGVAITHGSLDRFLASMRERPALADADVWLSVTSLSFDICALEIYLPLIVGARIEIAPRDVVADGRKLAELVEASGASVMQATPATWRLLLESGWSGRPGLKALCGGEAMPADLAAALLSGGAELWNMYGPTETTIWSAVGRIGQGDIIRLGEAIHETTLNLIDESGELVPAGGTGELCIGGANLARGYLNRPGLTADRFVPDPSGAPGDRLYRTGDLCRWEADGLKFLGRLDQQVKLRGFRVELGEIESELRALEGVVQAVVVGREDVPGDKRLVAYLVLDDKGQRDDTARLRDQLRTRLPDYMVPAQFVMLDALPLTPNGKIDRRALPAPETVEAARVHIEPRTPTEKILAGIWADVLGVAQVSALDDFYALGGHSLIATRLVSRISLALGRNVSLQSLFAHPVMADFAAEIDRQMPAPVDTVIAVRPAGQDRLPLSWEQERLWFLWCLEPQSPAYNLSGALRIEGELNVAALHGALSALVARHESLRVRIEEDDGVACQVIETAADFAWSTWNLTTLPEKRRPAKLEQQLREVAAAPFDLRRGKLLRARLVKLSAHEQVLVLAMHHIVADGWSIGILLRELSALYAAARNKQDAGLPSLLIQYGDYVLWQRQRLSDASAELQLNYWRARLGNEHTVLALPADRPRRGARQTAGGRVVHTVPSALADALGRLARTRQATLFMTLLAAFDALLGRYSGQQDIRIGIPVTGRHRKETEGLIGFFVNTLVLRAELSGAMPFAALLAQVRERVLEAQANQDLPFAQLIEALQPQRDPGHTPLFQVMFDVDHRKEEALDWPGIELSRLPAETGATQCDLTLTVRETWDGLQLSFGYASDLFDVTTIERLAAHYEDVLESICADPEVRLGHIRLRGAVPAPAMIYPFRPVTARIATRAAARADAEALNCEGTRLSFGELEIWSNRIARRLQRLGVEVEERVGLCVERSPALVAGLLGVLKAGAAYVPLDPSYPPARLRAMIEDAGVRRVVIDSDTARQLPELLAGCELVVVSEVHDESPERLDMPLRPDQLAYVIYTSGSTGRPKGVAISHGALSLHVDEFLGRYAVTSSDRVLQFSTISFDIAAHELLPPLTVGACVVMRGPEMWDSDTLNRQLFDERVNVAFLPTAYWQQWLQRLPAALPSLRQMTVGGEALPGDALKRWQAGPLSGVRLDNLYGPTETTIAALFHETGEADADCVVVPIGRPFPGRRIHLLDADGNPVPVGGFGELCIVGASLARGYLNRPGVTAERFVPDPLGVPGSRLYRTGDLCGQRADGTVKFLGRLDRQIKLRGFRIELGEIETALRRCAQVREAVAAMRGEGEQKRLVGYIVGDADPADVRRELTLGLPDYMVPSVVMRLPKLPLMANGKVDHKGLPEPEDVERADAEAPRTSAEATLLAIWQGVLKRQDVGVRDNFFAQGGDSISSLQVIARAREAGLRLTPKQMFEHPTIAGGAAVAELTAVRAEPQPVDTGPLPLSPIQAWFFERYPEGPSHWNQAMLLRVTGELDADVLDTCLKTLVARHDALRLRFETSSSGIWQQRIVARETNALLECIDLGAAADWAKRAEAEGTRLQQSLDLGRGPLIKAGYFRSGQERRLLLAIHHLAVDGVSWRVLLDELQQLIGQIEQGEPAVLPPPGTSWTTWTTKLAAYATRSFVAAELDWWQRMLTPAVGAKLPVQEGGDRSMGASRELMFRLSTDATGRLLEAASRAYRMRPDEVMLTALTQTFAAWSGQRAVLIDLEGHGREDVIEDVDLSGTVGWFTTRYPVCLAAEDEPNAALIGTKERLRAVPHKGLHFGLLRRFAEPEIATVARALPTGEVSFNYLGQFDQSFGGDGRLTFLPESSGRSVAASSAMNHALDLNGLIVDGVLTLRWRFSPDVVAEPTVRGLIEDFGTRLERLVSHCAAARPTVTASDFALSGLPQQNLERLGLELDGVQDIYPATPLQQGLMYHALLQQRDGVYVNQVRFTLGRELDPSALRAAWDAAVARHDVLRTGFEWRHGGDALQVVYQRVTLPWAEHDWSSENAEAYEVRLATWCGEDLAHGFALQAAPLMRLALFVRPDGARDLIWTFHHALMDGWSGAQLLSEIARDYRARLTHAIPDLPAARSYRDYVAWLQRQPSAEAWWSSRLGASGDAAGLTDSFGRPRRIEPGIHRIRVQLDPGLAERLRSAAQRRQVTLNTLMQGAWAIVLARFAGRPRVVFGATVSGRPSALPGVEQMLGLFINSLPVWVDIPGEATVTSWLQQLQRQNGELRQYEHTPLSDLQRWAGQSGDSLFDSLFAFENYPVDAFMHAEAGALPVTRVDIQERTHYPLTLTIVPRADVSLLWAWDGQRLDRESVERLSRYYRSVLEQLAEDRERHVGEIVPTNEVPVSEASATYAFRSLTDRIAEQVTAGPARAALTDGESHLSYGELEAWSNRIARRLRRLGVVAPDQRIGLCVERSSALVAGLLGVLKAGGAYVPLDPSYPEERLRYVLEDSAIRQVVVDRASAERLRDVFGNRELVVLTELDHEAADPLEAVTIHPEQLAYVIYTSGSTGQPKGVGVTHRNAARLFDATQAWFRFDSDDVWTLFHSYAFDFSVWEIFGALVHGGRLVVVPQQTARDPRAFHALLRREQVTVLNQTPSAFMALMHVDATSEQPADSLRVVVFGGEKLDPASLTRWHAERGAGAPALINMYGITETTVHVTYRPLGRGDIDDDRPPSLIGGPLPDLTLHVLDHDMNPVPVGAAGELYVGGAGLARGYLNRAGLTAERFMPDPFGSSGGRLYRSGDLARRLPGGELEYIGRNDWQVKVRGYRVELGEIEAALLAHPQLREAAVVTVEDGHGGHALAAYVVAVQAMPEMEVLRAHLEARLPSHMVPASFTFLPRLPLTINGKLDRKMLPSPASPVAAAVAPRTDTERVLCRAFADVLGVPTVGVQDDFFLLGGNSLSAVRVAFRLAEELGCEVGPAALFRYPTVAVLAAHLDTEADASTPQPSGSLMNLLDGLD